MKKEYLAQKYITESRKNICSKRLRKYRQDVDITINEIADILDIESKFIELLESAKLVPAMPHIVSLGKVYESSIHKIMAFDYPGDYEVRYGPQGGSGEESNYTDLKRQIYTEEDELNLLVSTHHEDLLIEYKLDRLEYYCSCFYTWK